MTNETPEKPKIEKAGKTKKNEIEELRQQIETLRKDKDALQKEKDEIFSRLQRVIADYLNFQKRTPKHISDAIAYEKEKIIKTLLPVLDNFEHTLGNCGTAENADAIIKGVQITYDHLLDILKSHDVEQIKAVGEKFEPSLHQAMMQQANPDKENDIVIEELQKGYKLGGRVIRPSKVIVNKLPSEQKSQQPQETPPPEEQKPQIKSPPSEGFETTDIE